MPFLNIILSILSISVFMKLIIPAILIVIIIYLVAHYTGLDTGALLNQFSVLISKATTGISTCFEYIKHFF